MRLTREPYLLVHGDSWRRDGKVMVLSQRHGQAILEPFNETFEAQQWYFGLNGEIFTRVGDQTRYLRFSEGCMALSVSSRVPEDAGWAFVSMGENPHRYRIVPRECPSKSVRATTGSFMAALEITGLEDDTNTWYIVTLDELSGKKLAHVRPMS